MIATIYTKIISGDVAGATDGVGLTWVSIFENSDLIILFENELHDMLNLMKVWALFLVWDHRIDD